MRLRNYDNIIVVETVEFFLYYFEISVLFFFCVFVDDRTIIIV